MNEKQWAMVASEIKLMLHASRDCMRNRFTGNRSRLRDPRRVRFDVNDGYYGEAFGILRGLALLGFGDIHGAVNTPQQRLNFRWWLKELESEVLAEENFGGSGVCEFCKAKWGKDDSTL